MKRKSFDVLNHIDCFIVGVFCLVIVIIILSILAILLGLPWLTNLIEQIVDKL